MCIVTGASSGIGREVAMALAGMGCHVIMGCRDVDKAEKVKEQIILDINEMRGIRNPRKRKKLSRKR